MWAAHYTHCIVLGTRKQWELSYQRCLVFRVNNKHIWWNSKERLWLVIVSAEKPITPKFECFLRLWHLLNWVQRALGGQNGACFYYPASEHLCVFKQREEDRKSRFPPNIRLHFPMTSDGTDRDTGTGRDLRWVLLIAAGYGMEIWTAPFD